MFRYKYVDTFSELEEILLEKKPEFVFKALIDQRFINGVQISFVSEEEVVQFEYFMGKGVDVLKRYKKDLDKFSNLVESLGLKEIEGIIAILKKTNEVYCILRPIEKQEENLQKSFDSWVYMMNKIESGSKVLNTITESKSVVADLIVGSVHYCKTFELAGKRTLLEALKKVKNVSFDDKTEAVRWYKNLYNLLNS